MQAQSAFKLLPLSQCGRLQLVPEEVAQYQRDEGKEFRTVYMLEQSDSASYYYLHEQHLQQYDGSICARLCDNCFKSVSGKLSNTVENHLSLLPPDDVVSRAQLQRPEFNVGNGYDFGHIPVGLSACFNLTLAERVAVSSIVNFMTLIKFVNSDVPGMKGHNISFDHNGKYTVASVLPRSDIGKHIKAAFIGSSEQWQELQGDEVKRTRFFQKYGLLHINVERVYSFLYFKKRTDHIHYGHILIEDNEVIRQTLANVPAQILADTFVSDDATAKKIDVENSDNVARQELPEGGTVAGGLDDNIVLESVYVARPVTASLPEDARILQSLYQTINDANMGRDDATTAISPLDDVASPSQQSARGPIPIVANSLPVNVYERTKDLLLGSFPHLFLLGQGVKSKGPLSAKAIRHLLLQYDGRFAKDEKLLFLLFNTMQLAATSSSVGLRVKSDSATLSSFQRLVSDPDFLEKLACAISSPEAAESKRLSAQIIRTIHLTGPKIPYSRVEREDVRSQLLAMITYAGAFSFFVTVSPSDQDAAIMLKLSNETTSIEGSTTDDPITFRLPNLRDRHRILARNPVAAASFYMALVEGLFEHLIGLKPAHMTKTSAAETPNTRREGLLGVPICYLGVTEMQGRQSAHIHFVLKTDICPITLRTYVDHPQYREQLMARLDSMIQTHLPTYAADISKELSADTGTCNEPTAFTRDTRRKLDVGDNTLLTATCESMTPEQLCDLETTLAKLYDRGYAVSFKTNQHRHSSTCYKGPVGKWRCRLALPFGSWNGRTCFLQLKLKKLADGKCEVMAMQDINELNFHEHCNYDPLLLFKDERVIVVELFRPHVCGDIPVADVSATYHNPFNVLDPTTMSEQDILAWGERWVDIGVGDSSLIVTFSPLMSSVLGCNTCVDPLGNISQSKAITYYLIKYMTKDCASLTNSLSLVKAAFEHISKYPSRAEDSGSEQRVSQHLLTRLLNSINDEEYGGQTAALATLGFPSSISSHAFSFCFIRPAIKHCKRAHEINPPAAISVDLTVAAADIEQQQTEADDMELSLSHEIEEDYDDDALNSSHTITTDGTGRVITLPLEVNYMHRGAALADMSLWTYTGVVRTVKRKDTDSTSGRKCNARFNFSQDHPRFETDEQMLASKQTIPLLAGPAPPRHPGSFVDSPEWHRKANAFAEYVICLHYPWNLQTHAPDIPLNWTSLQAWIAADLAPASASIMSKATLFWIRVLSQGMRISATTLKTISGWRSRFSHRWTSVERRLASLPEFEIIGESSEDIVESGLGEQVLQELRALNAILDPNVALCDTAINAQKGIQVLQYCHGDSERNLQRACNADRVIMTDCVLVSEICDRIQDPQRDIVNSDSDYTYDTDVNGAMPSGPNESQDEVAVADEGIVHLPGLQLNEKQKQAYDKVITWYDADAEELAAIARLPSWHHANRIRQVKPLRLLIEGAAGTGKSFFVKQLINQIQSSNVVCTAYTGSAASGLPNGKTTHSCFGLECRTTRSVGGKSVSKDSNGSLHARAAFGNARVLVIDEVSLMNAQVFEAINDRLVEWFGEDAGTFGGIGIILMGDFFQIPSIGSPIINASKQSKVAKLFGEFECISFTEQMRAADDNAHASRLGAFRNPDASSTPVKYTSILDAASTLSPADFADEIGFRTAPILCADNASRMMYNKVRAIEFAKYTNQCVIAWRHKLDTKTQQHFNNAAVRRECTVDDLVSRFEELTFYFVEGAPVALNRNIATDLCLTNGTLAKLHSLTMSDEVAEELRLRVREAMPGDVVFLGSQPMSVNIEVETPLSANWSRSLSLMNGRAIVPITMSKFWTELDAVTAKEARRRLDAMHHTSLKFKDFDMELAFAMTFHKVQGKTLNKVILDFNNSKLAHMSLAALYVGVSRVRRGTDIRIMPLDPSIREHLEGLTFNEQLCKWWRRLK